MRNSLFLGAVAATALSTAATAQVTGVVTSRTVTYKAIGPFGAYPDPVSKGNSAFELGSGSTTYQAENYQVSANVGASEIDFADNTTSQGYTAYTSASTSVDVTYTNGGGLLLHPTLQSTIMPGGFGFYMADVTRNPTHQGGLAFGDVNQSPEATGASFANWQAYAGSGPQVLASFNFSILSGGVTVYSLSDTVSLTISGPFQATVNAADPLPLNGFALVTPAGSMSAVGYQWNATTIDVPLGVTLAPGESSTLTYLTSVTTSTNVLYPDITAQVLAYAGFGDPIGKTTGAGGIPDPYFARLALGLPTFDPATGTVGLPALPISLPSLALPGRPDAPFEPVPNAVLGVPEPGSWAFLVVGAGFVGWSVRRRSRAILA